MDEQESRDNTNSRLLDLPAELRSRIYEFQTLNDLETFTSTLTLPVLLTTSKQIREEYSSVFFSSSLLQFEAYDVETETWHRILNKNNKRLILETARISDLAFFWSLASARRFCQREYEISSGRRWGM